MNEEETIDKVRKLLRLAQSANQHEAARAMEHAIRLAAKHKIDVATLDLDPELDAILHQRFPVGERLSYIAKLTLNVVVEFFNVKVIVSRPEAIFVGTATDVAVAHYVHGFLSGTCRRALVEFERSKRRKPSASRRQNFCAGFIYGVRHQLRQARGQMVVEDSKYALILRSQEDRREAYAANLVPKTHALTRGKKARRNQSAVMAGFDRGLETSIRTPLTGGESILRLE